MKTFMLALVTLTLTATALTLGVMHSPELAYRQKKLTIWLDELDTLDREQWTRAAEAVRALGTNTLPTLSRRLRAKDSLVVREVLELCQDYPILDLVPAEAHYEGALEACRILGPLAAPLLPDIVPFLSDNRRGKAVKVLVAVGEAAIPALESALRSRDSQACAGAAVALGGIARQPTTAVPALRELLVDSHAETRMAAVWALGRFGAEAMFAATQITRLTNDPAINVREQAKLAWNRIIAGTPIGQ